MLKGSAGQENFYDDITPEWNVPGSPLWCDLAMSRTLGLRQSVSGPRSGQCHRSREWYRGLVVALSGSGSEYRSLNGVDGLSPCLAGHSTLVRLGEDRGGRDQHLNTVRVLWSCVVFCLSSDSGSDAGLGSGRGALAPAWLSVTACWLWESHRGLVVTEISVTAGPGPGPQHITAVSCCYRDTRMRHLMHAAPPRGHRRQCDVGLTPDYPVKDQSSVQSQWASGDTGAGDTRACWHSQPRTEVNKKMTDVGPQHLWLLLLLCLCPAVVQPNPDAKRLYDDLLSNYNRLIRPVANNTDKITVKMGLKLSQLVDLVSKTGSPS